MNTRNGAWLILAIAAVGLCLPGSRFFAQQEAPPQPPVEKIGFIDLSIVFKDYEKFKQKIEAMKLTVKLKEQELKEEFEAGKKKKEELETLTKGTEEYRELAKEVARLESEFQSKRTNSAKEFTELESALFAETMDVIQAAIDKAAQQKGYTVIFRLKTTPIDKSDRKEVLEGINRPIVYHREEADLTKTVLEELNHGE